MSIIKNIVMAIMGENVHHQEIINPFEESDKLIDHAKESYLEILKEKERTVRERTYSLQSNS